MLKYRKKVDKDYRMRKWKETTVWESKERKRSNKREIKTGVKRERK